MSRASAQYLGKVMDHLISSAGLSRKEIESLFHVADEFNEGVFSFVDSGTTLALLFEKPSTRTRISLESAMIKLGGESIYIDASTTQISRGETVGDTAKVISSYVDMIAARMYRHSDIVQLARYSSVPVINALTDLEHPCQALSDLYTIKQVKGKIDGIKIAFVGDIAANTANSLMVSATLMGADVALVGPKENQPNKKYVSIARKHGSVKTYSNVREGLRDADVIYTDTFVSMGQENEAERRRKLFSAYQVNRKLVGYAKNDAIIMHCLPAHRGEEITSDVLDGKRSVVWLQAQNKMIIEKAIILHLYKEKRGSL